MSGGTSARRWLWVLLLAVVVVWFGNIQYRKLVRPDEGRYAEIPREMVASGDWVTPRLNGLKYFEKPPLQYWATAVAYEAFGQHEWTSRLWDALTGFAGLLLVWFAGMRLFGREAGWYAALLLGSSLLYVMMGHINTLDMGVTFFITLGIVGLLLAQQPNINKYTARNWMWLAWAALGMAVLSKGLMGVVLPGAALVIYSLLQRDFGLWKRIHLGSGLLICILVCAPWFYLVMKANPEFFDKFIIYEHFTRFLTKKLGRYQPWYYFVPILIAGALPWTLLVFDTLLRTWRGSAVRYKSFNPERFLLVWIVFVYVFFSISDSKLPSYLLPMFPAMALLMGRQLVVMTPRRLFWLIAPMLPLALLALALAPQAAKLADNPLEIEMYGNYSHWLVAAALVWLFGVAASLFLLHRERKPTALLVLALCSLLTAQLGVSGHNTVARERSGYYIAQVIRPLVKPGEPFYSVQMYEQTLPFYLKRTFTLVAYQDEMAFGIMREPERWIPDFGQFARVWQAQPEALAIMPVLVYPQLQKEGLAMKVVYRDTQYVVVSKP
jgi:4-amino-4-deoxy-L-arabinose transferase-like glycosyltransferase